MHEDVTGMTLAEIAEATGIERVEVLHGHTSRDTAYVIPDYPYGRELRCQRAVWLERASKGAHNGEFRFVWQTTNPRADGEVWNKPHASTYYAWAVLVRKPEQGEHYIDWWAIPSYGPGPAADVRVRVSGIYAGLNDDERKLYDAHLKLARTYSPDTWARWDTVIVPGMLKWRAEHGEFPPAAATTALGTYLSESDHQAAVAAALMQMKP